MIKNYLLIVLNGSKTHQTLMESLKIVIKIITQICKFGLPFLQKRMKFKKW